MALPDVQHDADLARRTGGAERLHSSSVREEGVVHRLASGGGIRTSGREEACPVPRPDRDRLVESGPTPHSVAESVEDEGGVLCEPIRDVAVRPTATVLQRLWQVPMVERDV